MSWIEWHCTIEGNEFLVEIDKPYIKDGFNLKGLAPKFSLYSDALAMILGESPESDDLESESFSLIYQQAVDLYGLIHARFIITTKGLNLVKAKFISKEYGLC